MAGQIVREGRRPNAMGPEAGAASASTALNTCAQLAFGIYQRPDYLVVRLRSANQWSAREGRVGCRPAVPVEWVKRHPYPGRSCARATVDAAVRQRPQPGERSQRLHTARWSGLTRTASTTSGPAATGRTKRTADAAVQPAATTASVPPTAAITTAASGASDQSRERQSSSGPRSVPATTSSTTGFVSANRRRRRWACRVASHARPETCSERRASAACRSPDAR